MKKIGFKKFVLVISILLLLLNLSLFAINLNEHKIFSSNRFTAQSTSAEIRFCIKPPFTMTDIATTCGDNITLRNNQTFYCELEYTAADPDELYFGYNFITSPELNLFEINSANGNISFTTNSSSWGDHSVQIAVDDAACGPHDLSYHEYNFTLNFNNTPPEYYRDLPNVTMDQKQTLIAYYLNDYFRDADNDPLTYSLLSYNNEAISVHIIPGTSEVIIRALDNVCGDYYITFMATDTYPASALSDPPAKVTIDCNNEDNDGPSGGGGGGLIESCVEDWTCLEWSDCYPPSLDKQEFITGYQKMSCYDRNSCEEDNYKQTRYRECEYTIPAGCYPEWECTDWTICRKDGTKERACFDLNECPTNDQIRFGIPEITQFCVYSESCSDGIKNNNEMGVDCGGPCEPCKTIESPSIIFDSNKILSWFIGIIVAMIATILILYKIFRKQIKQIFSKLVWLLVKKTARQIYLGGKEKERILKEVENYGKDLSNKIKKDKLTNNELNELESELFVLFRKSFAEMLDLDFEATKEEFMKKIMKLETTEEFRIIIINFIERFIRLEKEGRKEVDGRKEIFSDIDEIILDFNALKFFIFNISDKVDISRFKDIKLKTKTSKNNLFKIINETNKAYIYLQHLQLKKGKNTYLEMIELYESLDEKDKTKIYELTSTLFKILTYVSSHIAHN